MRKTYHGSCHCGAVKFEVTLDLSTGTGKCNCSICTKTRSWGVLAKPSEFRLLSGDSDLNDYQFGTKSGHHLFCRHCGVRCFSRGYVEQIGGDFVSIQVATLDDATPDELLSGPVGFGDGRNNLWWNEPKETRHL